LRILSETDIFLSNNHLLKIKNQSVNDRFRYLLPNSHPRNFFRAPRASDQIMALVLGSRIKNYNTNIAFSKIKSSDFGE